jgi:hypothetical protein
MDLRHTLPNIHYLIQAVLTTSVSTTPSSISVLSISSYARHRRTKSDSGSVKPSTRTTLTPLASIRNANSRVPSPVDIQSNPLSSPMKADSRHHSTLTHINPSSDDNTSKVNGNAQGKARRTSKLKLSRTKDVATNNMQTGSVTQGN